MPNDLCISQASRKHSGVCAAPRWCFHQHSYSSLPSSEEWFSFLTIAVKSCLNLSFLGAIELCPGKVCVHVSSQVNEILDFHPHWNATLIKSGIKQYKSFVKAAICSLEGGGQKRKRERANQQAEACRDWSALQRKMGTAGHKKYFVAFICKEGYITFLCILYLYIYTYVYLYINVYLSLHRFTHA